MIFANRFLIRSVLLCSSHFNFKKTCSIRNFHIQLCASRLLNMKHLKSTSIKEFKLMSTMHDEMVSLQLKKRQQRKKRVAKDEDFKAEGFYNVTAFATAEEYDLENLLDGLQQQDLYAPQKFFSTDNLDAEQDVLYVTAKYQIEKEPRDIFFFREGSVVLWNCNDVESNNILELVKKYERDRYRYSLIKGESETMPYTYLPEDMNGAQFKDGKFYLTKGQDNFLEKYTFSNALTTSIKLGIWEATLDHYIDSMEFITKDLKQGTKIQISRSDLLRKTGELFALRHLINLSSDLLDTPDFYWDREELEALYLKVCNYFSITRRTKVMNEKLNHCVELADLVSSHLSDRHHVRLEWMIIILIMVEVGFEIIHYLERYYSNKETKDEISTEIVQ